MTRLIPRARGADPRASPTFGPTFVSHLKALFAAFPAISSVTGSVMEGFVYRPAAVFVQPDSSRKTQLFTSGFNVVPPIETNVGALQASSLSTQEMLFAPLMPTLQTFNALFSSAVRSFCQVPSYEQAV